MTVMGETGIEQEKKPYASRVYPNDRDGGKPVFSGKGYPTRHGYSLMIVTGEIDIVWERGSNASRV